MSDVSIAELAAKVQDLEARLSHLEGVTYKRAGLGTAIKRLISSWPGPFTAQQLWTALGEVRPDLINGYKEGSMTVVLLKLEKQGIVLRIHNGCGQVATIWEKAARTEAGAGNPGGKLGRRHDYESGFRSIVRAAIASPELPEQFTLGDIRAWVSKHMPNTQIPYGSWSSTLYKLQQHNELLVVKAAHTVPRKVYRRGQVVVNASGEELAETERAWSEFKRSLQRDGKTLTAPEIESALERGGGQ
jgi:hypothetical protein